MARVTKATLLQSNKYLNASNLSLIRENEHLKEVNKLLEQRQFDVDAFCRMHAEGISAIAHVVTDLRALAQKLH